MALLTRPKVAGRIAKEFPVPRRKVIEYECDRCHRKWWENDEVEVASLNGKLFLPVGVKADSGEPLPLPALITEVSFDVLCTGCTRTVCNYVSSILKVKRVDSDAKEEGAEAPSNTDTDITLLEDVSSSAKRGDGMSARAAGRGPSS